MLTVISGSAKGKPLYAPSRGTRPMTNRAKQALFSIIQNKVPNAEVLDLFAGSGALGIESLSRGAHHTTFVDIAKESEEMIWKNLLNCKFEKSQFQVWKTDAMDFVLRLVKKVYKEQEGKIEESEVTRYDLIFITPPYKDLSIEIIRLAGRVLKKDGVLITDAPYQQELPKEVAELELVEKRNYGRIDLYFYMHKD